MEKKRHIHADLMIAYAEDQSIVIETFQPDENGNGIWFIAKHPSFSEASLYRLHEREFPKTSLSDKELEDIVNAAVIRSLDDSYIYRNVANAAIKQYIIDTEKESK